MVSLCPHALGILSPRRTKQSLAECKYNRPMDAIRSLGRSTFRSLYTRNFRLYFIGQAVSLSGTWMQTVAIGWLALELSDSGTKLGIVVALQFLPLLLLGAWGGVVVDRFDKRVILFWTQSVFFVTSLALGLFVYFDIVQFWMLYAFSLALGCTRVFDNPARQSFVTEMVGQDSVKNAVSLNSTANNLARAVGPSVGGVLIASVGIAFCFIVNALSYLALIVTLRMMRAQELHIEHVPRKEAGALLAGLRYVRNSPVIRDTLIVIAIIGTFAYEFQVSLPLLARMTFDSGASAYAALLAAMGIGSVVGGLFAAGRHKIVPNHFLMYAAAFGASMIATAFMPTLDLAILGMVVVGFFSINVTSIANTMIQLESAPEMRGRVMGLWSTAMIGSTPIGGPIVGLIGQYIGARWGLAIGGAATLLAVAPAIHALVRERVLFAPSEMEPIYEERESEGAKLQ